MTKQKINTKILNENSDAILYLLKNHDYDYFKDIQLLEFANFNLKSVQKKYKLDTSMANIPYLFDNISNFIFVNTFDSNFNSLLFKIIEAVAQIKCSAMHDIPQEELSKKIKKLMEDAGVEFSDGKITFSEALSLISQTIEIEHDNHFVEYLKCKVNTNAVLAVYSMYIVQKISKILNRRAYTFKKELGTNLFNIDDENKFCIELQEHHYFKVMLGNGYEKGTKGYLTAQDSNQIIKLCIDSSFFVNAHRKYFVMYQLIEVVAHELCHLVHFNHSKDFWTLMETLGFEVNYNLKWSDGNGEWYYHTFPGSTLQQECKSIVDALQSGAADKEIGFKNNDAFDINSLCVNTADWYQKYLENKEFMEGTLD